MLNPEVDGGSGGDIPKLGSQTQLILCPMPLISDMPGGLTLHNMNTKPKPELKEYHEKWQTGQAFLIKLKGYVFCGWGSCVVCVWMCVCVCLGWCGCVCVCVCV
jgi:hypothetical protein